MPARIFFKPNQEIFSFHQSASKSMGGRDEVPIMFTEHWEVKRAEISEAKPPCSFH